MFECTELGEFGTRTEGLVANFSGMIDVDDTKYSTPALYVNRMVQCKTISFYVAKL